MCRSYGTQLSIILFRRVKTRRYNIFRPSGTFKTHSILNSHNFNALNMNFNSFSTLF